jgi:hypothetical protein
MSLRFPLGNERQRSPPSGVPRYGEDAALRRGQSIDDKMNRTALALHPGTRAYESAAITSHGLPVFFEPPTVRKHHAVCHRAGEQEKF